MSAEPSNAELGLALAPDSYETYPQPTVAETPTVLAVVATPTTTPVTNTFHSRADQPSNIVTVQRIILTVFGLWIIMAIALSLGLMLINVPDLLKELNIH